jgi:hypothetical protein
LLGNEPVSHGDLRTQNGILRQVTLVMHCQSPPIAVEPPHIFASRSPCKGRGRIGCACRISGTGLPIPACLREKIFFLAVPETRISRRSGGERSAPAPESGTFALRVLWTLPQAHQNFLFHEVRGLCRHYLRSKPEDASEISPEELVSEVWEKLIGSITMPDPNDAAERSNFPDPSDWTIDSQVPGSASAVLPRLTSIYGGLQYRSCTSTATRRLNFAPRTHRPEVHRWYCTAGWQRRRAHQLMIEPLCRLCLEAERVTPATVADFHRAARRPRMKQLTCCS